MGIITIKNIGGNTVLKNMDSMKKDGTGKAAYGRL